MKKAVKLQRREMKKEIKRLQNQLRRLSNIESVSSMDLRPTVTLCISAKTSRERYLMNPDLWEEYTKKDLAIMLAKDLIDKGLVKDSTKSIYPFGDIEMKLRITVVK